MNWQRKLLYLVNTVIKEISKMIPCDKLTVRISIEQKNDSDSFQLVWQDWYERAIECLTG